MIKIIPGDPEKIAGGATSSFFILPFRYKITPINIKNPPDIFYREVETHHNNKQWTERKRYFSRETSCVLFERTRRFQITDPEAWKNSSDSHIHPKTIEFKATPDKKYGSAAEPETIYKVKIEPPEVILFEYSENNATESDIFQTGLLVVKTWFSDEEGLPAAKLEHLLHFNERFRYWRKNYTEHEVELRELSNLTGGRKNLDDEEENLELYIHRWQRLLTIPFSRKDEDGRYRYYQFIPDMWCEEAENWFLDELGHRSDNNKDTGWIIYNDTRTFVYTNAVIEGGSKAFEKFNRDRDIVTEPEAFGHWVKLLNIDALSAAQWWRLDNDTTLNDASHFEEKWAKKRSYKRWAHEGTLYGFNYHASAMLSGPCAEPPLSKTFRRHYFDMTILLLYLRISIFRFSNAMNENTIPAMSAKKTGNWEKDFLKLRKKFAFFTNLYQFPLISNQQQMLEMYQIARENMDIDELFKEVENEIKNTHEYFSIEESEKRNQTLLWIAGIGMVIGAAGLFSVPWGEIIDFLFP